MRRELILLQKRSVRNGAKEWCQGVVPRGCVKYPFPSPSLLLSSSCNLHYICTQAHGNTKNHRKYNENGTAGDGPEKTCRYALTTLATQQTPITTAQMVHKNYKKLSQTHQHGKDACQQTASDSMLDLHLPR